MGQSCGTGAMQEWVKDQGLAAATPRTCLAGLAPLPTQPRHHPTRLLGTLQHVESIAALHRSCLSAPDPQHRGWGP